MKDPNWNEQGETLGEMYDDLMAIIRQDFGDMLLSDADLPETEWDMNIDEADDYAFE